MSLKHLPEDDGLTPSEIAAAVVSIERRKAVDTEQPRQEVDIADVLQHLNLGISPGEIFAEVAKQRQKNIQRSQAKRRAGLGVLAALAAVFGTVNVVSHSLSSSEQTMATYSLTWPQVQQQVLAQDTIQGRQIVRTLAEVPDDHMVRTTDDGVYSAISKEWPSIGPGLPIDNTLSIMTWRVFKSGNHLYVRGWTRERLSPGASKISPVEVYDTPDAPGLGPTPVQISVRITPGSVFSPFAAGPLYERPRAHSWECFNFSSVQIDEHTWEKW